MKHIHRTTGLQRGFSLIEVMIAVLVLATGLLALGALQTSLARSSAEAKVRGRVASLLSARMDELRVRQYDSAVPLPQDSCEIDLGVDAFGVNRDWVPASFCQEAGLGAITTTQTVATWSSAVNAATFTQGRAPAVGEPQFKRVTLTASWTDSNNQPHRLSMVSELSALALRDALLPPPPGSGTPTGAPVVRTENPSGPGVIPIAIGGGDATAASNPRPEIIGASNNQSTVGTRFDVLTYQGLSGAAVIQRRVETAAIKCSCKYGAGGANLPEIYRDAQWPAVWTGERYDVYKPDAAGTAPGAIFASGPTPGVDQSALCQECCRDHHDGSATNVARFDPERGSAHGHYTPNNPTQAVVNTNNAVYGESCRVIRVDGFWRTAADTYSRQFGLLETETVAGAKAKTGLPTSSAVTAYEAFVKDYLDAYDGSVATAPTGAQAMFDAPVRGLNNPPSVLIGAPSNSDYRYLHGRALYVDHLEAKARKKLVDVLARKCPGGSCPSGTVVADVVLPFLPFTSINLTEIAAWRASDPNVLTVNSGNLLVTNPAQPSGSRTLGTRVGNSDNTGTSRISNSGVAVSSLIAGGVDPADDSTVESDAQAFQVGGVEGTGDRFDVRLSGGGLNPFVFYNILADSGECLKPSGGDHRCSTSTTLGSLGGSIRLQNYWSLTTVSVATSVVLNGKQCTYNGSPVAVETTGQNANVAVPAFRNYVVSSASMNGVPGTIGAAVNDNKLTESTTITFGSIPDDGLALVALAEQAGSPTVGTLVSCTATKQGNKYFFDIPTAKYSKPWEQP